MPFRDDDAEIIQLISTAPRSEQAGLVLAALAAANVKAVTVLDSDQCPAPATDDQDATHLIKALLTAADGLNGESSVARFPRTRLVAHLVQLSVTPDRGRDASAMLRDRLKAYWERPETGSAAELESGLQLLPPPISTISAFLVRVTHRNFGLWYLGVPGLNSECRWLRRQRRWAAAGDTFTTFLFKLTLADSRLSPQVVRRLAVLAFLADLRASFRPRLGWPWGWKLRLMRPVLVLDRVSDETVTREIARARSVAPTDPLLVVIVPRSGETESCHVTRYCALGEGSSVSAQPPRLPGRLAGAGLMSAAALIVALLLVSGVFRVPGLERLQAATVRAAPGGDCGLSSNPRVSARAQGYWWPSVTASDRECVGYSTTDDLVFSNDYHFAQPDLQEQDQQHQDARTVWDQQQVFGEDARADKLATQHSRQEVTLIYLAGITQGDDEDYDSGQAEELEGLLAAQREANVDDSSEPVLKIVVANGGSQMQRADSVAKLLVPLIKQDPSIVGVVGMDRSNTDVENAINEFRGQHTTVLADTLSADQFENLGQYYFSLSPPNSAEAELMLDYVKKTVTRYFKQPRGSYDSAGQSVPDRVLVYEPPSTSNGDFYIKSLVKDLKTYGPHYLNPRTTPVTVVTSTAKLCGSDTVVIYAGRHDLPSGGASGQYDDFANFDTVVNQCAEGMHPFVIADDGVTRFIADPASREKEAGVVPQASTSQSVISYVTKGLKILQTGADCLKVSTARQVPGNLALQEFCAQYAQIVTGLKKHDSKVQLPWTGERVGLAYDSAEMFLTADINASKTLTRAAIPGAFESRSYPGVTGTVRFSLHNHVGTDAAGGMPLAIVRISLLEPNALPVCAVTSAIADHGGRPANTPNPVDIGCVHGQY